MLPRPLVTGLAVLISIMWTANLIVGFLYPDRNEPSLNAIFAIVVGAVFALQRRGEGTTRAARKKLAKLIEPSEPEEDPQGDRGDRP